MKNFVMKKMKRATKNMMLCFLRSNFAFVRITFLLPFIFLILFLSGCVGMNGKFDCNVGSGGKCAPMSHINKMANFGEFSEGFKYGADKENAIAKAENKIHKGSNYLNNSSVTSGTPIRTNETIQQIWIGPYEDSTGIYHEPTTIHAVVKKGQWIGVGGAAKIVED